MTFQEEARSLIKSHLWSATQRWVLREGCSSADYRREQAQIRRLHEIEVALGEDQVKALWAEVRAEIRSQLAEQVKPVLEPEVIDGWLRGTPVKRSSLLQDWPEEEVRLALSYIWHMKLAESSGPIDWSDSAVSFSRDFLKNDGGMIFEASANIRTLARTIKILRDHVTSAGPTADPVKRRTMQRLLRAANELNLLDACRLLLTTAGQEGQETAKDDG